MFKEKIQKDLKKLIIKELEEVSEELDIKLDFSEDDILIYGSIFEKENPNDIDVFLKIRIDLNDSNEEYQNFDFEYDSEHYDGEVDALNALKDYLHKNTSLKNQLEYKDKKVDINVELNDFEELKLTGENQNLDQFLYDMEDLRIENQKKMLRESNTPNIFNNEEAKTKFAELARSQRGEPEIKMVQIQKYAGGFNS